MKENKIIIQKASAGSGKTEALASQYANTLISEYKTDRDAYKHIMAVTFTNAATEEMKERILLKLDRISRDKDDRNNSIARDILCRIVNDYTMFRVSTIDSFFQSILKSFALELGSSATFQVSIDDKSVVEAAIDSLYAKLGEDRTFLKDLVSMYQEQIEEGSDWNYKNKINATSEEVTRESYRKLEATGDYSKIRREVSAYLSKDYPKALEKVVTAIEELTKKYPLAVDNLIKRQAVSKLCESPSAFIVDGKGDMSKLFEALNKDKWFKNTADRTLIAMQESFMSELSDLIIEFKDNVYSKYLTYRAINRTISITSLFAKIKSEMAEYCRREQISLLSDAPDILRRLIAGSDTPFVYEKIGTSLRHYLLDEFQDTSARQWMNFKPLLKESVDKGHGSFVVGDVKQSIYSFRGADWNILNNRIIEDFRADQVEVENMEFNYRSCKNIVEFNNNFFSYTVGDETAPGALCSDLAESVAYSSDEGKTYTREFREIYKDVSQKVARDGYEGFVSLITTNTKINKNYREECVLFDIRRKISELTGKNGNYKKSDIVILVSSNSEVAKVSNYLTQEWRPTDFSVAELSGTKGMKVVSSDSMYLSSSKFVSVMIAILEQINDSGSKSVDILSKIGQLGNIDSRVVKEGISEVAGKEHHTLYELCDTLLANPKCIAPSLKCEVSFINSFMDRVLYYTINYGSNLGAFLKWWGENAADFAIPSPNDEDAVMVMTMHKAKGLSAKVVFVPFLRENLRLKDDRAWMRPSCGEYKGIPFLVSPIADFLNSYFIDDYRKASLHGAIDTFNLAYVAFTRAKEKMYIYMQADASDLNLSKYLLAYADKSISLSDGRIKFIDASDDVIIKALKKVRGDYVETDVYMRRYNIGDESGCVAHIGKPKEIAAYLSEYKSNTTIRGALRSVTFGKEDDIRHKGIILHEAYSMLGSLDEQNADSQILEAAERLVKSNPSYKILGECAKDIASLMRGQIDSVKEYNWFSKEYESINECEILYRGEFWRPDRVLVRPESKDEAIVVDYKFGVTEAGARFNALKSKYEKQVSSYMELLSKMGYKSVKGYLWFVMAGIVSEVR